MIPRRGGVVYQDIPGKYEIPTNGDGKIRGKMFQVFALELKSFILHFANIHPGHGIHNTRRLRQIATLEENPRSMLIEVISLPLQPPEHRQPDANIELGDLFPRNLVIGRLRNPDTSISTTPRQTERESWRSHIECRIIDKAASASDIVIPHQTVGGADFEHVDHVSDRLEEFLFRHHPAHCG